MEKRLTYAQFGEYLRQKRKELGMSQAELSAKTGIDRTYLSMLENRGNPAFNKIQEIVKALNLSLEDFFKLELQEASKPIISVMLPNETKNKQVMQRLLTSVTFPVPILNSPIPLRSKVIEEQYIEGYCLYDRTLYEPSDEQKLVCWIPKEFPTMNYTIVNILDTEIKDYSIYLFEYESQILLRQVTNSDGGFILIPPMQKDTIKMIVIFGKKRESLQVFGRVLSMCKKC